MIFSNTDNCLICVSQGLEDSLNYNTSQTSYGMKLSFCMWPDTYRSKRFTQSFLDMPKFMPNIKSASFEE